MMQAEIQNIPQFMTMNDCNKLKVRVLIVFLMTFYSVCAQLPKLVFAPHWLPQAQFTGYYVAQEMGFYKEAGVDVEIIHPSANLQVTSLLNSRKADVISLFLTTALSVRNQGTDLVNIGQISQHSAILIVTKKSRGIEKLSQLNGKKIGVWKSGFDELPKALIANQKLQVEWVPILSSVNLFMMDGIDAMTVMSYNEYDQIINCGLDENELNVFRLADFGFDIPEDGLYCSLSTFHEKKSVLGKFLMATLKGWEYAAANRNFAIGVVLGRMEAEHVPANRVHQEWMLTRMFDLIAPGAKNCQRGELLESDFLKAAAIISNRDQKKVGYKFAEFYQNLLK